MRTYEFEKFGLLVDDDGNCVQCSETGYEYKQQNSNGYRQVQKTINGKRKTLMVHRLVAMAFIPNPLDKPDVNHIDGNKRNNHFSNLEWVTEKENTQHAMKYLKNKPGRPVSMRDRNARIVDEFLSGTQRSELMVKFNLKRPALNLVLRNASKISNKIAA